MRDEHIAQLQLILKLRKKSKDTLSDQLVQRARHLIADDELGLCRKRAGNTDALFLTALQLGGQAIDILTGRHFDLFQQVLDAIAFRLTGQTHVEFDRAADDFADGFAGV
jgi:hypothetical protein